MTDTDFRNPVVQVKGLQRIVQGAEVALSTYRTLVFLIGFSVFSGLWVAGVFENWYDFVVLISGLTLGILISRITFLRFYGLELATDQWMQALQYEILRRHFFPQQGPDLKDTRGTAPDVKSGSKGGSP